MIAEYRFCSLKPGIRPASPGECGRLSPPSPTSCGAHRAVAPNSRNAWATAF